MIERKSIRKKLIKSKEMKENEMEMMLEMIYEHHRVCIGLKLGLKSRMSHTVYDRGRRYDVNHKHKGEEYLQDYEP